jgi:SAM-dependent methyltransferase
MLDVSLTEAPCERLPDYLRDVYTWAYLTPWLARALDNKLVVQAILWGNAQKLTDAVLERLEPGMEVMQPAAVYGDFSRQVGGRIGEAGMLTVRDVANLQVELTRRKVAGLPQVAVELHDASLPAATHFDAVACFFLLHEVPDEVKRQIVPAMLHQVRGKGQAIFVDYHRPRPGHPLAPLMRLVFRYLEPFATGLWRHEIVELAGSAASDFRWSKSTRFGGLYQVVVAERI